MSRSIWGDSFMMLCDYCAHHMEKYSEKETVWKHYCTRELGECRRLKDYPLKCGEFQHATSSEGRLPFIRDIRRLQQWESDAKEDYKIEKEKRQKYERLAKERWHEIKKLKKILKEAQDVGRKRKENDARL